MKNAPLTLILAVAVAACGSDADTAADEAATAEAPAGTVTIVSPEDGSVVTGSTVTVELESTVSILPAGQMEAGTGHHHIYFDADLTEPGVPVPTVPGSIEHKGDASSTFTFENVAPGEHRIIAVVADGAHVPLQPWVVDTVTITVRQ